MKANSIEHRRGHRESTRQIRDRIEENSDSSSNKRCRAQALNELSGVAQHVREFWAIVQRSIDANAGLCFSISIGPVRFCFIRRRTRLQKTVKRFWYERFYEVVVETCLDRTFYIVRLTKSGQGDQ